MDELDRPATQRQLLAMSDACAQGAGFLVAMALRQVAPDRADAFWESIETLTVGTHLEEFVGQAIVGMEAAIYDIDGAPPA